MDNRSLVTGHWPADVAEQLDKATPPAWPAVTCLCPTYGRFECLRLSLACFLAQDYPGEKRLLILNDAPVPLSVDTGNWSLVTGRGPSVTVVNSPCRFGSLGEKRQALLEASSTELAAHWDDDDLYLPWHLTRSVEALQALDVGAVKSAGGWYMKGRAPALEVRGPCHNVFEGTMVFRREEALALGGYPPLHSGQAKALLGAFEKAGRLYRIPDDYVGARPPTAGELAVPAPSTPGPSYVYRWANGVGHISAVGNKPESAERFRASNQDFGDGSPLTPGDLAPYWAALDEACTSPHRQSQSGNPQ